MKLRIEFKEYLKNKNLCDTSINNYLSDIKRFLDWSAKKDNGKCLLSHQDFKDYIRFLKNQGVSVGNIKRYVSALKQFGQFLVDSGKTKSDPTTKLKNITQGQVIAYKFDWAILIDKYGKYLEKQSFSPLTVKNYLADIRQFINWSKNNYEP